MKIQGKSRPCNWSDTKKHHEIQATPPPPATVHRRRTVAATPPEVFELWKFSASSPAQALTRSSPLLQV